jgi:hypothetical protein
MKPAISINNFLKMMIAAQRAKQIRKGARARLFKVQVRGLRASRSKRSSKG